MFREISVKPRSDRRTSQPPEWTRNIPFGGVSQNMAQNCYSQLKGHTARAGTTANPLRLKILPPTSLTRRFCGDLSHNFFAFKITRGGVIPLPTS
jgi:hypothetical protein